MEKLLYQCALGKKTAKTPIWFMRQAGRYLPEYREIRKYHNTLTMFKTPKIATEITLQPIRRFESLDGAIIYADILLIPDAFGLGLSFIEKEGPRFKRTIRSASDLLSISEKAENVDQVVKDLSYVGQAIADVKAQLPNHVTMLGFAGAPFTVASYMIEGGSAKKDFIETKKLMYGAPDTFHELQRLITKATIAYLDMQVAAGAEVLQLFESWSGAISPEDYRKFCLPYSQQILQTLKKKVPVIHFLGQGAGLLDDILNVEPPSVLSIDWRQDLQTVCNKLTKQDYKVTLQGNLDPQILYAPPHILKSKIETCLKVGTEYPNGYIFNLGHGITPETPIENVELMIQTVKNYLSH
ncbi:MAG: uroporphyrinogen decarboxylase [Silvanigrellaceae bacterium]|nr:uroporphyrinogen decarboxylase [Silvanigrellaceae bacterium]